MGDEGDKGFKVSDRRARREEQPGAAKPEQPLADAGQAAKEAPPGGVEPEAEVPPIDFISFVLSLASAVLIHLGEVPDPVTQAREVNLIMAKQTVDVLAIIQEKTRGNLSETESRTLENLLADLKMRYLKAINFVS